MLSLPRSPATHLLWVPISYGPHTTLETSQEKARWMLMLHSLAGLVWRGRPVPGAAVPVTPEKDKGGSSQGGIGLPVISLLSAQEEPSISLGMQHLCLIADRVSPKGWSCSLLKMTYNGPGLISVSKCIFCALSPQGGGRFRQF